MTSGSECGRAVYKDNPFFFPCLYLVLPVFLISTDIISLSSSPPRQAQEPGGRCGFGQLLELCSPLPLGMDAGHGREPAMLRKGPEAPEERGQGAALRQDPLSKRQGGDCVSLLSGRGTSEAPMGGG